MGCGIRRDHLALNPLEMQRSRTKRPRAKEILYRYPDPILVSPSTATSSRGRTSQDQDPTRLHASRFLRPVFSPQFQSSSFNLTPPRLFVSAIPLAPSPSFCSFFQGIRGGRLGSILIHRRTDYVHRLASPCLPPVIPPNTIELDLPCFL